MSASPGYDLIVQAYGGLMSITGTPDGDPTKVGVAIIDVIAGLMLGKSICAALYAREKTGVGQRLDTSLLEAQVASLVNAGSNYLIGGQIPRRYGNAHPSIVPYQSFKTADGYLVVGVASETIWKRFCAAIGRGDLADDSRFAKNAGRVAHREELLGLLSQILGRRNSESWLKILQEAEVPCAPVQTVDQVFDDAQVRHRGMLAEMEHPSAGTIRMAGIPVKFSGTPASLRLPPPRIGEHTEEVLQDWLGLTLQEIRGLREKGIV
jgi:crotonobetainyl-CoA:carnitine CoA-transferase CaiB-like acyl-CoA transferase